VNEPRNDGERRQITVDAAVWGAGPGDQSLWIERRGQSLSVLLFVGTLLILLPLAALGDVLQGKPFHAAAAALAWPVCWKAWRWIRRWRQDTAAPP